MDGWVPTSETFPVPWLWSKPFSSPFLFPAPLKAFPLSRIESQTEGFLALVQDFLLPFFFVVCLFSFICHTKKQKSLADTSAQLDFTMGAMRSVHRGLANGRHSKSVVATIVLLLVWSTLVFFYHHGFTSDVVMGGHLPSDKQASHYAEKKPKTGSQTSASGPNSLAAAGTDKVPTPTPRPAPPSKEPATEASIAQEYTTTIEVAGAAGPVATPDPASSASTIPKKLWYKLGPQGLTHQAYRWTATCIQQNPGYEVNYLTEQGGDAYVQKIFGKSRPDLVEIYLALSGT